MISEQPKPAPEDTSPEPPAILHALTLTVDDAELGLARACNMIRRRGFYIANLTATEAATDSRIGRPLRIEATLRGDRSIDWLKKLLENQPGFTVERFD